MPLSYQEHTSPSSNNYTVTFPYLTTNDIKAVGKDTGDSSWTDLTTSASVSSGVTTATVSGSTSYDLVRIYRASTTAGLVDFQKGSRLSENDLDTAYKQGLFVAQEVSENAKEQIAVVGPAGADGADGQDGADGADGTDGADGADGADASGGGVIGQVASTHTNDVTFSTTSSTPADVTGLSVSITPSSTSSKILVQAMVTFSGISNNRTYVGLKRGSTPIANGDASGSRMPNVTTGIQQLSNNNLNSVVINFLDSPSSSSELTYQITGCCEGSHTFRLNRAQTDSDSSTVARGSSTITVMEVLA